MWSLRIYEKQTTAQFVNDPRKKESLKIHKTKKLIELFVRARAY